jgi:hypothetical protein
MTTEEQNKQNQESFLLLVRHICARPAMYVGVADFRLVTTFLCGYSCGFDQAQGKRSLMINDRGFGIWLMDKYQINSPGWGQTRIIFHHSNHSHKESFKNLASLYEEFIETFDSKLLDDFWSDRWKSLPGLECSLCENMWPVPEEYNKSEKK